MTVGPFDDLGSEEVAKTEEAATQSASSDARRKTIVAREMFFRFRGEPLSF